MPRLVHLAPERLARRIDRSGLRGAPWEIEVDGVARNVAEVVFAMPVVRISLSLISGCENFVVGATIEWLRSYPLHAAV